VLLPQCGCYSHTVTVHTVWVPKTEAALTCEPNVARPDQVLYHQDMECCASPPLGGGINHCRLHWFMQRHDHATSCHASLSLSVQGPALLVATGSAGDSSCWRYGPHHCNASLPILASQQPCEPLTSARLFRTAHDGVKQGQPVQSGKGGEAGAVPDSAISRDHHGEGHQSPSAISRVRRSFCQGCYKGDTRTVPSRGGTALGRCSHRHQS
jgi:hypothetical protein